MFKIITSLVNDLAVELEKLEHWDLSKSANNILGLINTAATDAAAAEQKIAGILQIASEIKSTTTGNAANLVSGVEALVSTAATIVK